MRYHIRYYNLFYAENLKKGIFYDPWLSPRQEELLSWIQGRAPIGEVVYLYLSKEILIDFLPHADHSVFGVNISRLIKKGYLKEVPNSQRKQRAVIVLRTLEQARVEFPKN